LIDALHCHQNYVKDILIQYRIEIDILARLLFYYLGTLLKAKLIAFLELSIVFIELLNCVVGEMHERLVN
jgi:hypothetical protein